MSSNSDKITKSSHRSSYISTVVGISLVLYMLGALGLILVNAQKLSDYVKENIQLQVFLEDDVRESEVFKLKKSIDAENYVKTTQFITKEHAAKELKAEIGEDFLTFLGFNPLSSSIEVYLNANYASNDSIAWIEKDLLANRFVKEVVYSPDLIEIVNNNIDKITLVLLAFSFLLLFVSIALINNTIRLAIFSKRFLIKTMKLVGATHAFIKRPFIRSGVAQGLLSAFIAMVLILVSVRLVQNEIPEFMTLQDTASFAKVFAGVVLLGIVICWISTNLAVRKYIRLKSEEVY
jgi:cell division transport system permease protein